MIFPGPGCGGNDKVPIGRVIHTDLEVRKVSEMRLIIHKSICATKTHTPDLLPFRATPYFFPEMKTRELFPVGERNAIVFWRTTRSE